MNSGAPQMVEPGAVWRCAAAAADVRSCCLRPARSQLTFTRRDSCCSVRLRLAPPQPCMHGSPAPPRPAPPDAPVPSPATAHGVGLSRSRPDITSLTSPERQQSGTFPPCLPSLPHPPPPSPSLPPSRPHIMSPAQHLLRILLILWVPEIDLFSVSLSVYVSGCFFLSLSYSDVALMLGRVSAARGSLTSASVVRFRSHRSLRLVSFS